MTPAAPTAEDTAIGALTAARDTLTDLIGAAQLLPTSMVRKYAADTLAEVEQALALLGTPETTP